jgi:uncharacterized protein YbbK (DUF523 family)/predicted RNA-binding protein with PUA-like domain
MKPHDPRPAVGVSACLLGQEVRYDGGHKRDRWISGELARRVRFVPVCPEMEIGLGTPRPPIRLEEGSLGVRLVEPSSGRDLTATMRRFAEGRARALREMGIAGFVLKARSPSCGIDDVEVRPRGGGAARRGERGRFADALLRILPGLPVADEERLRDPRARRAFLGRVLDYDRRVRRPAKEAAPVNRWLLKSDPDTYSFADLVRDGTTRWDGVKNPAALIHMRAMAAGDEVLVYETGDVKAVVGVAVVAKGAYPDPKAKDPRLVAVDLRAGKPLAKPVPLAAVKADAAFRDLGLVRMGRLSVMPVTAAQWKGLFALAGAGR